MIVCDPRKIETARIADIYAPLANGSNVAFLNAMMNVILEEGLQDQNLLMNTPKTSMRSMKP